MGQQSAESVLRTLAANASDALAFTDARRVVQWVNRQFESETGYVLEDIRGRGLEQLLVNLTGNSELVLSRELAERRIFPAIDLVASATRREELLLSKEALAASVILRQRIAGMTPINAMNDLLTDLKRYPTNQALIKALNEG